MKILVLIVMLFISVQIVGAQAVTETAAECREAAQAWYDEIDTDGVLLESYTTVVLERGRNTEKTLQILNVSLLKDTIQNLSFPKCATLARDWYLLGIDDFTVALSGIVDSDILTYARYITSAAQWIGQFRGYLVALGVQVDGPGTLPFYVK